MTKKELEKKIIEAAIAEPKQFGEYKLLNNLMKKIAYIMGYEVVTFRDGHWHIRGYGKETLEAMETLRTIVAGMEKRNIIVKSKNGNCYRMA